MRPHHDRQHPLSLPGLAVMRERPPARWGRRRRAPKAARHGG